jgi:hypothetical protein
VITFASWRQGLDSFLIVLTLPTSTLWHPDVDKRLTRAEVQASASRSRLSAFVFLSWASGHLFWNFIFHLVTTLYADSYSPGLVTASLLYYPVSIWGGVLAVRQQRLTVAAVLGAFAIGAVLMMMFVIWARPVALPPAVATISSGLTSS